MLVLPLMSCSARMPIYIMIIGTFFAARYQSLIMISLYAIGIILAVILSRVFSKFVVKGEDTPFVMELPPYRLPTAKAILRHTWEKGKQYLKKMGGIILVASIIVWALGYFPHDDSLTEQQQQEQSYIGIMGKAVEPIFAAQGFDWRLDVSLIAGVGAKEIVASTMGVLGGFEGLSPLVAYAYLLFVLLYFPCIATIIAIKHETGTWRWALTAAVYTTCVAWIVSALVYQIGAVF
jgi:ferrous iron transport protein B